MLELFKIRRFPQDEKIQFIDLMRHFYRRLFDIDFISRDAEARLGVVHILTLLAFPGVYYAMLRFMNYEHDASQLTTAGFTADALSDQCLYVFFSMAVTGVVAVLEWDRLFPDGRDYANLIPLPLKLRTIFCAKIVALFEFVGLFILAVAGAPVLFYPLAASEGVRPAPSVQDFLRAMAAHGIAVFSGCLFMFLLFVALQGVLINLLTYAQFRKISFYVQGLATVVLVCLLFLLPLIPELLPAWQKTHSSWLYALPPMWFLGLYQTLLGARDALFSSLSYIAIIGFVLSAGVAAVTYFIAYRRHGQMTFESPEEGSTGHLGIARLLGRLLDRFWLKEGPERGTFYFVLVTLARSAKQRLNFIAYVSVALALVLSGILGAMVYLARGTLWASIAQPGGGLLSIPLVVSFFTLVGMRAAFEFPAALPANWIFQITEESNGKMCQAGVRKALIAVAIAPPFVVSFVIYAKLWGPISSMLTVLFGMLLCLILTELLLYSSRKIPFTCSHFPGKTNLSLIGAIGCLAFALCAYAMALLEKRLFQEPRVWIVAVAVELVVLNRIMVYRNRSFTNGLGVQYEDKPLPTVQTLGLNA
jgi:hypothetical protein